MGHHYNITAVDITLRLTEVEDPIIESLLPLCLSGSLSGACCCSPLTPAVCRAAPTAVAPRLGSERLESIFGCILRAAELACMRAPLPRAAFDIDGVGARREREASEKSRDASESASAPSDAAARRMSGARVRESERGRSSRGGARAVGGVRAPKNGGGAATSCPSIASKRRKRRPST